MAVGDERAHAARLGESQRLAVVGLAALGVESVGMGRDVAEQVQRIGREPGMSGREFDRAVTQTLRLVEPAEQQTGATQRMVVPAAMADESLRRLTLESCSPSRSRSSASLASPSCARTQAEEATADGSRSDDVPRPEHRNPVLDQCARLRPIALEQVERARGDGRPGRQ